MPALVAQVDAAYRDEDAERERIHRMRLRIAAGDHAGAIEQIHALRRLRHDKGVAGADTALLAYEILSAAKQAEAEGTLAADALRDAFRTHYGTLDDRSAHRLKPTFLADLPSAQADLRKAAAPAIEHGRLDLPQARPLDQLRCEPAATLVRHGRLEELRLVVRERRHQVPFPGGLRVQAGLLAQRRDQRGVELLAQQLEPAIGRLVAGRYDAQDPGRGPGSLPTRPIALE